MALVNPLTIRSIQKAPSNSPVTGTPTKITSSEDLSGKVISGGTIVTKDDTRPSSFSSTMKKYAKQIQSDGNIIEKLVATAYLTDDDPTIRGSSAEYEQRSSEWLKKNFNIDTSKKSESGNLVIDAGSEFVKGVVAAPSSLQRLITSGAFGLVGQARQSDPISNIKEGAKTAAKTTVNAAVDNPAYFAGGVATGLVSGGIVSGLVRGGVRGGARAGIKSGTSTAARTVSTPKLVVTKLTTGTRSKLGSLGKTTQKQTRVTKPVTLVLDAKSSTKILSKQTSGRIKNTANEQRGIVAQQKATNRFIQTLTPAERNILIERRSLGINDTIGEAKQLIKQGREGKLATITLVKSSKKTSGGALKEREIIAGKNGNTYVKLTANEWDALFGKQGASTKRVSKQIEKGFVSVKLNAAETKAVLGGKTVKQAKKVSGKPKTSGPQKQTQVKMGSEKINKKSVAIKLDAVETKAVLGGKTVRQAKKSSGKSKTSGTGEQTLIQKQKANTQKIDVKTYNPKTGKFDTVTKSIDVKKEIVSINKKSPSGGVIKTKKTQTHQSQRAGRAVTKPKTTPTKPTKSSTKSKTLIVVPGGGAKIKPTYRNTKIEIVVSQTDDPQIKDPTIVIPKPPKPDMPPVIEVVTKIDPTTTTPENTEQKRRTRIIPQGKITENQVPKITQKVSQVPKSASKKKSKPKFQLKLEEKKTRTTRKRKPKSAIRHEVVNQFPWLSIDTKPKAAPKRIRK